MFGDRTFRILITVFCYLFVLEGLSWFTSAGPGPCIIGPEEHQSAQQQANQQDCPTFFAGSLILLTRADHVIERHDKSIVAVFTIVLALSTIGLWVATVRLWRSTNSTLEHAETAAESELRAYVSVVPGASFRQGMTRGYRFEFRPVLLNTGQTPAYRVNVATGIRFLTHQEFAALNIPDVLRAWPAGVPTLGRGQDRFTATIMDRRLTKAELRAYQTGTRTILVFGTVTYRTFNRDRYTNFCFAIPYWTKRGGPIWQTTTLHNDSD